MTPDTLSQIKQRIAIDEGSGAKMYYDSVGVPTIGIGFNLQRSDARVALEQAGVAAGDVDAVMNGSQALTQAQIDALFAYSFKPIESEARASLAPGVFDALDPARQFVLCDLVYNLGEDGWEQFGGTIALINHAQAAKNSGQGDEAHTLFGAAADHLTATAWYGQVGDRAKRDVAMMRTSAWCDPQGNGSDVL